LVGGGPDAVGGQLNFAAACLLFVISINFVMRSNVDQRQNVIITTGFFFFSKNNPTVVAARAGEQSGKLSAEMMGLEFWIVEISGHVLQSLFDLRLQGRIFFDQSPKGAFESGRENKLWHLNLPVIMQPEVER